MKKKVLTVLYNMLSGNFSTTLKEILYCFPCEEHKQAQMSLDELINNDIVYNLTMRNDSGQFTGVQHYINWGKFDDCMIDQSLV